MNCTIMYIHSDSYVIKKRFLHILQSFPDIMLIILEALAIGYISNKNLSAHLKTSIRL